MIERVQKVTLLSLAKRRLQGVTLKESNFFPKLTNGASDCGKSNEGTGGGMACEGIFIPSSSSWGAFLAGDAFNGCSTEGKPSPDDVDFSCERECLIIIVVVVVVLVLLPAEADHSALFFSRSPADRKVSSAGDDAEREGRKVEIATLLGGV